MVVRKAGEGDRTLDIQLGMRNVSSRNRALRVFVGGILAKLYIIL
jgi:hypothetical protein